MTTLLYCCLIHRYQKENITKALPAWMQDSLTLSTKFAPAFAAIQHFFRGRKNLQSVRLRPLQSWEAAFLVQCFAGNIVLNLSSLARVCVGQVSATGALYFT
ncbi:hypothetical protein MRX96_006680 [Rhipicephalus microplus]